MQLVVVRCQLGDRNAFDALVDRWHGPLCAYARRTLGDAAAAEEVVQDAWLRILRGIGRLRDPAALPAWLFSILRRSVADQLRARYAEPPVEDAGCEPAALHR